MAHVYPACIKRDGHPEDCYHWVADTYVSDPGLCHWSELVSDTHLSAELAMHFQTHKEQYGTYDNTVSSMCGNPWNHFANEEEREFIRKTCPPTMKHPVHGTRPITTIQVLDTQASQKNMIEFIQGDCWSVFGRNHNDLTPTHSFYFSPFSSCNNSEPCTGSCPDRDFGDGSVLTTYLNQHPDEELCISLGCKPFIDLYVYKNHDDMYVHVVVSVELRRAK